MQLSLPLVCSVLTEALVKWLEGWSGGWPLPSAWQLTHGSRDLLLLFTHSVVSDSLRPHGLQHARLPCPSLSPGACSNSGPLSRWCHPTISSSVAPFSSCLPSFPASGCFTLPYVIIRVLKAISERVSLSHCHVLSTQQPYSSFKIISTF